MNMPTFPKALGFILLVSLYGQLSAAGIEIIQLKHQSAEQIIPVIQPLIGKDSVVTGTGYKLIVKASASQIAKIRKLVEEIDTPLQQLVITVRQDQETSGQFDRRGISGQLNNEHTHIRLGQPVQGGGLNASIQRNHYELQTNINQTNTYNNSKSNQTVRAISGQAAFIQIGQSMPVPQQQIYVRNKQTIVNRSVLYKNINTGFYVTPRLHGLRVILEVSAYRQQLGQSGSGNINTQHIATRVEGPLGEWIELGNMNEIMKNRHSSLLNQHQSFVHDSRQIFIKVELAGKRP